MITNCLREFEFELIHVQADDQFSLFIIVSLAKIYLFLYNLFISVIFLEHTEFRGASELKSMYSLLRR